MDFSTLLGSWFVINRVKQDKKSGLEYHSHYLISKDDLLKTSVWGSSFSDSIFFVELDSLSSYSNSIFSHSFSIVVTSYFGTFLISLETTSWS